MQLKSRLSSCSTQLGSPRCVGKCLLYYTKPPLYVHRCGAKLQPRHRYEFELTVAPVQILALGAGGAVAGSLYCDHLDNVMASKCMFIEEWSNVDKLTERCQIKENLCDELIDKYNVQCKK